MDFNGTQNKAANLLKDALEVLDITSKSIDSISESMSKEEAEKLAKEVRDKMPDDAAIKDIVARSNEILKGYNL